MRTVKLSLQKPDTIGAITGVLCIVHCIVTPIIFVAHSCALNGCESAPVWWRNIDYLFLLISFFSIYRSTQTTRNRIMKPILWSNWSLLFILTINEKIRLFLLPETIIYITAFTLAIMHIYNLNYCQCKNDKCCTQNG